MKAPDLLVADRRPSPIAGRWYPAEPSRLAASVDAYLAAARPTALDGTVVAVVAPHAGHTYSGPVAGSAFAALRGLAPDLIALVGPLHEPHPAAILSSVHEAYQTPLGVVPVDRGAVRSFEAHLRREADLRLAYVARDDEHSLEIELPFLQRALARPFCLLPLMMRPAPADAVRRVGRALSLTLRARSAVLVASTDLSHYHPQAVAERLDSDMLRRIQAFDPEAILRAEADGGGSACGAEALAAVLWAAQDLGADRVRILHHATSGDTSGDRSRVVGYAAAVVTRAAGSDGNASGGSP